MSWVGWLGIRAISRELFGYVLRLEEDSLCPRGLYRFF